MCSKCRRLCVTSGRLWVSAVAAIQASGIRDRDGPRLTRFAQSATRSHHPERSRCIASRWSSKRLDTRLSPISDDCPAIQFGHGHIGDAQEISGQVHVIEISAGIAFELIGNNIRIEQKLRHYLSCSYYSRSLASLGDQAAPFGAPSRYSSNPSKASFNSGQSSCLVGERKLHALPPRQSSSSDRQDSRIHRNLAPPRR